MALTTEVLPAGEAKSIEVAVKALRKGGVVVFPTDTVYGIGALGRSVQGVAKLFRAKGRPSGKAIPLLIGRPDDLSLVATAGEVARRLIVAFWPGGLTLVLPRTSWVPDIVTSGGATVAVRQPNHPVALNLIRAAEEPLAATSANVSGGPELVTIEEVVAQMFGLADVILDGGTCPGGIASTVVDVSSSTPRLLREGAISRARIEQVLGRPLSS